MKSCIFALVVATAIPSTVLGEQYTCVFNRWKGAEGNSEDAAISWVGTSFTVQTSANSSQAKIKKIFSGGETDWINTSVKRAESYTTFVYYEVVEDNQNRRTQMRYGFRIHASGRCNAYAEPSGFRPIIAEGRYK